MRALTTAEVGVTAPHHGPHFNHTGLGRQCTGQQTNQMLHNSNNIGRAVSGYAD